MAQPSLDDRITAMQGQLSQPQPEDVPVSGMGDNHPNFTPEGRRKVYITQPTAPPVEGQLGAGSEGIPPVQGLTDTAQASGNPLPLPTPPDNMPELVDQKRQQVLESLKAEGFDGYTPDVSRPKEWTMDDNHAVSQAVQDIAAGFNISLAKTLSLPRETVDRGLGLLGLDYLQHGSPQQQTIDALNHMGIPSYEVENLANKIGKGALPALATYTAMQLAAPSMAANTVGQTIAGVSPRMPSVSGPAGYLMREMGQWAERHPVLGLWLGQAASAGGQTAKHVTGKDNAAVEFAGEIAGGGGPGALKFAAGKLPLARAAVGLVGKGVDAISDALPTALGNAIKRYNPLYKPPPVPNYPEGLFNPNLDANRVQTFAKDQVYAAQSYQDRAIETAINSIPSSGTPARVQTRTHELLQEAEKISKRIVGEFWGRVPLRTKLNVNDIRQETISLKNELADLDNQRPDTVLDKIITEMAPTRNPAGQFKATQMTVAKLRDYQGQIGTAITEERARDAPREGVVRNLARLSEIIDRGIADQLPNVTSIEQARQMSQRHNDLFSRGPINDILSKRRTGDFRVPQGDSIDSLMQKTDGLAALKAVQEGVSTYPRIPQTRFQPRGYYASPFAASPAEQATLDSLVAEAQNSIRTSFREAADQGPQKAVAFSQKNEDELKALGSVAGELAFAAQKVSTALAEKKAINASALARFAETSPDKAVQNIFSQRDPAGVAHQLMISFRGDPAALEGLQNEVLNHFIYTVGKTNPNVMQKMMQTPRIENLLQTVLSTEQFGRLSNMINTAVKLGVEDQTSLMQAFKYPARTAGRIVGAKIGRMLNTGTIQTPAIISKAAGTWVEAKFGVTNPSDMLAQAVIDPKWEAMLYSRIPTTTRDMKAAQIKYRRIFAGIDTAQKQLMSRYSEPKDTSDADEE